MAEVTAQFSAFISYASPDREKADEVCASLEAHGFSCWIAPRNIRAGHDYADAIIHGIHSSKCLVLILSSHANESPFVHREVERAVSANKMIFPLRIQEVLPSAALELFVSSAHWIDAWKGKLDDHVALLVRDLSDDDSAIKTPAPAAPPPPTRSGSKLVVILAAVVIVVGIAGFLASRMSGNSAPAPQPAAVITPPVVVTPPAVVAPPAAVVAPSAPLPVQPINPVVMRPAPPIPKPAGAVQLTPTVTPDGQQPLTVYEFYRSNLGKFQYTFLCPANTATVRASYDGEGYFETPQTPLNRPYPVTLQDWPAGDNLKLIFKAADGTETGPFEFAAQDRQSVIFSALKTEFLAGSPEAVTGYLVPFTLPFTDDPQQELAAAQAATEPADRQQLLQAYQATVRDQNVIKSRLRGAGCGFVTTAPTVVCFSQYRRISLAAWAAVREVHIGVATGQTTTVIPVNIDWDEFLKRGNDYFTANPEWWQGRQNIWNAMLPPDTTDIYAVFVFRDGTSTDEMRYRVDTTHLHE